MVNYSFTIPAAISSKIWAPSNISRPASSALTSATNTNNPRAPSLSFRALAALILFILLPLSLPALLLAGQVQTLPSQQYVPPPAIHVNPQTNQSQTKKPIPPMLPAPQGPTREI